MRLHRGVYILSLAALALAQAAGQSIVSARSGVVNFCEGAVTVDGRPLEQKFGSFPELKEGTELRTGKGRAEILLTPGVYLRVGEESAFRMDSTTLVDTRVEFLRGAAMVEVAEKPNGTAVVISYRGYKMRFPEQGMFRLDTDTLEFRVLEGQAEIALSGEKRVLTARHSVALAGGLVTETFTPSLGDGLYEWSMRRSDRMTQANTPADPADALDSLSAGAGSLPSLPDGAWVTSPFTGMSTYVPYYDAALSRLGIGYSSMYSPYAFYGGGLYGGVYGLSVRGALGSSLYRVPPGHSTHGNYIYAPTPIYRPGAGVNSGFGRASHPVSGGTAIPSGGAVRAPVVGGAHGAAGHR